MPDVYEVNRLKVLNRSVIGKQAEGMQRCRRIQSCF